MKVLATYSIKGGVGKTTAAVNLGVEASPLGARVLLWDLDPQGAATFFVRVKPSLKGGAERLVSERGELADHVRATDVPGLHVLPADFSLRHLDLHLDDTTPDRLGDLLAPLGPALRRRPARLPAGHHADERGRVRRRRRPARADDPVDAVGAHARPAVDVPRRRSTTRRICCRSSR